MTECSYTNVLDHHTLHFADSCRCNPAPEETYKGGSHSREHVQKRKDLFKYLLILQNPIGAPVSSNSRSRRSQFWHSTSHLCCAQKNALASIRNEETTPFRFKEIERERERGFAIERGCAQARHNTKRVQTRDEKLMNWMWEFFEVKDGCREARWTKRKEMTSSANIYIYIYSFLGSPPPRNAHSFQMGLF